MEVLSLFLIIRTRLIVRSAELLVSEYATPEVNTVTAGKGMMTFRKRNGCEQ
jgi:hypothetical protein